MSTPFMVLGGLAGLVAIAWLAILGEWMAIGIGLAASFAMPLLFRIATLPGTGLLHSCDYLAEKGFRILAFPVGFLASLFNNLLVTAWCFSIFSYYAVVYCQDTCAPFLLWGYFVAMAPLARMAEFDSNDRPGGRFLFIFHLLYAVLAVSFTMGMPVEEALIRSLPLALITPCIALFGAITAPPRKAG